MDILSDILQNSLLQNDAIERERGVILREEEEIAKSEEETTYDRLHSMAYQGTPLDKLILGRCGDPTTWTTIQQNGPHHLGLWHIALPEHQMALINSGCVPFRGQGKQREHGVGIRTPEPPIQHIGLGVLYVLAC